MPIFVHSPRAPLWAQGKTVTLKLKNVNFELKSRAETQPCALATAEEIFAVAKDLLKTEIDSVSPQPLRLRLMGNLPFAAGLRVDAVVATLFFYCSCCICG